MEKTIEKIDRTSLKFNQGCIVIFTGLAFLLNVYWLVALVGAVLLIDTIIPGTGLFKLFYKNIVKPIKLLKPNISEESKAPHQFAQGMGGTFLLISFVLLQYFDLTFIGWGLSFIGNSNGGLSTNTVIKTAGGYTIVTSTTIILPTRELLLKVSNIIVCTALRMFLSSIM